MSIESALALIESVKDYKVLFVGDAIIDEYHYVTPLQRAAKEFLIPMRYEHEEVFHGGVDAAAAHLRTFCKTVDIASTAPTTCKVRFVDENALHKLAEVHYTNGDNNRKWPEFDDYDCVVAADFGHGEILHHATMAMAQFLAVSTQTNSANRGFNLITKYPSADYIVIDEPEARLAAADQNGPLEGVIKKLAIGRCDKFVVTWGSNGAMGYENGIIYHQPAFTDLVRDTMGAGDAFFAVTAPMAMTGSMQDLLFIGCAAGALKTQIVGHRSSVTKEALIDFIRAH
jgi:bifunctional ADP-heptose synthase (sugar kinase/adenylyltransferase)